MVSFGYFYTDNKNTIYRLKLVIKTLNFTNTDFMAIYTDTLVSFPGNIKTT